MSISEVILVDDEGRETGVMEKFEAHHKGSLHRAFSVFIIDSEGRMLLHQRADDKYHSANLWSNACCSHPVPGEEILAAATRRLQEEMGITCPLEEFDFMKYFVKFENGLIEHEYDHLLLGTYSGVVHPNAEEVKDFKYLSFDEIDREVKTHPEQFSFWFRMAYPLLKEHLKART